MENSLGAQACSSKDEEPLKPGNATWMIETEANDVDGWCEEQTLQKPFCYKMDQLVHLLLVILSRCLLGFLNGSRIAPFD